MMGAMGPGPAAGLVVGFLVLGALTVASLVLFVVALVDVVRRPDWQWKLAGQEKILWIILLCLVNVFGIVPLIYWFSIRKKLVAVEAAAASGQYPSGYLAGGGFVPGPYVAPPAAWPPGWYPDPAGGGGRRWWSGQGWTEHHRPGEPAGGSPPPDG